MATFINPSTESISFKRYQTSFYYESMEFIKEEFGDIGDNAFFKHIVGKKNTDTVEFDKKGSDGITRLNVLRSELLRDPFKTEKANLEKHIFTDQIFKNLFKYSIFNLLKTQQNTLFILPCYEQEDDNGASRFIKYIDTADINELYKDIFTNKNYTTNKTIKKSDTVTKKQQITAATAELTAAQQEYATKASEATKEKLTTAEKTVKDLTEKSNIDSNQIIFIKPFISDTNENIDTFKERIRENIIGIEETIKNRGNSNSIEPFTQIIYFVNKDNNVFTNYFKTELKKKQADELNKQLNDFYSKQKIGQQQINKSSTLKSELSEISVSSINNKLNNASKTIKESLKDAYGKLLDIKDTAFKQNEQLLLDKLNNFYKIRLDVSAMKSLSSTDNSSLFNIYIRFDNLDRPVVTNELRPNKDTLYKVYSGIFEPRIGFFSLSNKIKNQYTFTIDRNENMIYKESPEYEADKAKIKPQSEKDKEAAEQLKSEIEDIEAEEEVINATDNTIIQKTPRKNRIFEIRYNYGKIQYKDITKQLIVDWSNDNYIDYYKEKSIFENYKWFSHKMIDNKYKENINIKYYKNTVYDIPSLKEYLISEKKYTDKTRLAVEFLDINLNDQELIKYNNFIFEKFKKNINNSTLSSEENSKGNILFEDRIKRGICDILFEQNTLILIKTTVIQTEKEKEKATSDNFKMIKHIYTPINEVETQKRINEIKTYFEYNSNEREFLRCNNKPCPKPTDTDDALPLDLKSQLSNKKKAFAINLIKITKDVLADPVKLFLAAECKSRKKKIQEGYYKVLKMFAGGSIKRKQRKIKQPSKSRSKSQSNSRRNSHRKTKQPSKTKPQRKTKYRRTYSARYPKE
jgi:hypothetical protein